MWNDSSWQRLHARKSCQYYGMWTFNTWLLLLHWQKSWENHEKKTDFLKIRIFLSKWAANNSPTFLKIFSFWEHFENKSVFFSWFLSVCNGICSLDDCLHHVHLIGSLSIWVFAWDFSEWSQDWIYTFIKNKGMNLVLGQESKVFVWRSEA